MKRLYALILLLFSLILPFDGQDGSFLRAQGNDPVLGPWQMAQMCQSCNTIRKII